MDMDSPSKTTLDPDSYHTPFYGHQLPPSRFNPGFSRIFYSKKKKYKRNNPEHTHPFPSSNKSDHMPKSQKAGLVVLAEWLRWSAVSMGVNKHVYDNALALLREGSQKMETTYALAAASLVIAAKF